MNSRAFLGLTGIGLTSAVALVTLTGKSQVRAQITVPVPETQAALLTDAASVQALFEKSAAEPKFFDLKPFLYNRLSLDFGVKDADTAPKYFATLAKVTDRNLPLEAVKPLLTHADPKVRTLALAALFNREDPRLLPLIVKAADDNASTFPGHGELSETWLRFTGIGPPKQSQTVADVARAMVDFYTSRANFAPAPPTPRRGISQKISIPSYESKFDDYWAKFKGLAYSASWFQVKLARASRGTSPTQPQYVDDIRRVRAELDALPRTDRNWILLYLNGEAGGDALISEAEMRAAIRELGPDQLMKWLKDQPASQMPDLRIEEWRKQIILKNARFLLQPSHSGELLKQGELRRGKEGDWSLWYTAAAALDANIGRSIIKTAWPKFQRQYDGDNQIELAVALAEEGNRADWPFLADWFFAPKPRGYDATMSPGRQGAFISRLGWNPVLRLTEPRVRPAGKTSAFERQLIAHLVNDTRFNTSEFWAVCEVLQAVNASQPQPIANLQKFYESAWIGRSQSASAQAALKAMKDKLRATSPQWGR